MGFGAFAAARVAPLCFQQTEPDGPHVRIAMLSFAHVHANGYADRIRDHARARITVVWDELEHRGRDRAEHYGVPFEPDLGAALKRDDVDAVIVNSPTNVHQDVYFAAIDAGKHVFTEKALTIRTSDSDAVVEAVERSGVKFMVSLPSRCASDVLFLRNVVDQGLIGELTYIRTRIAHSAALDRWFSGDTEWFADPEVAGGGGLFDLGCHTVDVTRWLGGDPVSVVARMNSFTGAYPDVDDNAVAVVEFASKSLATMECAWVQRAGYSPIEIYGTEGYASIRTSADPILISSKVPQEELRDGRHPLELPPGLPSPLDQWISAILDGTEMTISVRDGRNLTELLEGCYLAAKSGRAVPFPIV